MSASSLGGWFLSRSLGKKLAVGMTIASTFVGVSLVRSSANPTVATTPVSETRSLDPLFDHLESLPVVKKWFVGQEATVAVEVTPATVVAIERPIVIVSKPVVELIPSPTEVIVPELIAAPQIIETQIVEAIVAPHEIVVIESLGLPREVVQDETLWARQLESVQQIGFQLIVGLEVFFAAQDEPKIDVKDVPKDPTKTDPKDPLKPTLDLSKDADVIAAVNKYIDDTKDNQQPFVKTIAAQKLSLAPGTFKFERSGDKLVLKWNAEAKPNADQLEALTKALNDLFIEVLVQKNKLDKEAVKGWWSKVELDYVVKEVSEEKKPDPVQPTIIILGPCDCGPAPSVHSPIVAMPAPTVSSCDGCGSMPAPVITHCEPAPTVHCAPAPKCEAPKRSLFGGGRLFGKMKCR